VVFGTRPEAIKLCPVVQHLRRLSERYRVCVAVTAQHREMLDQVLGVFGVKPDHDLNLMLPGQALAQTTARAVAALDQVLAEEEPDMVLVQGDTTSTLCGALAAFYRRVPVAHIEAGLRTGDRFQPFPEEMNRLLTTRLATLHMPATAEASENLLGEGVSEDAIIVTGNTVIDAVLRVSKLLRSGCIARPLWPWLDQNKRLLLVTAHRRENFGRGLEGICEALLRLSERRDVQIACTVHPNPQVQQTIHRLLEGRSGIRVLAPLDYLAFVDLMSLAHIILTDSGGIQEEGPALGKPILVLREKTERPEAVRAGTAKLVGCDPERIVAVAGELLDSPALYERMARVHNPYGDGQASARIECAIRSFLERKGALAAWQNRPLRDLLSPLLACGVVH